MRECNGYTLKDSLDRLVKIEETTFVKGWDGHNASPITKCVIELTKDVLLRLSKQPTILPTARNSIQLEYNNEYGAHLEFEVFSDKIDMFFYMTKGVSTVYRRIAKLDKINWIVVRFMRGDHNSIINGSCRE